MISATGLREIRNELFWRTIYLRKIQRIGVLITASAPDRSLKATDFAVIILCSLRLLALALLLLRCVKSRRKKKSYIIINIVCIFTVYFHYKQKASNTFVDIGALIRSRVTHTHTRYEREKLSQCLCLSMNTGSGCLVPYIALWLMKQYRDFYCYCFWIGCWWLFFPLDAALFYVKSLAHTFLWSEISAPVPNVR